MDKRVFSEKDNGAYDGMNKRSQRETGGWLYFLGSDDELHDENIKLRNIANGFVRALQCDK